VKAVAKSELRITTEITESIWQVLQENIKETSEERLFQNDIY
jgi:hypothetical protein